MASPYEAVSSGKLKLKGVSDHKIKKKKKRKEKDLQALVEREKRHGEGGSSSHQADQDGGSGTKTGYVDKRTKAEIAYDRVKHQRQDDTLLEEAAKTHKDRIIGFNRRLDALTEHFDVPKVSWTK